MKLLPLLLAALCGCASHPVSAPPGTTPTHVTIAGLGPAINPAIVHSLLKSEYETRSNYAARLRSVTPSRTWAVVRVTPFDVRYDAERGEISLTPGGWPDELQLYPALPVRVLNATCVGRISAPRAPTDARRAIDANAISLMIQIQLDAGRFWPVATVSALAVCDGTNVIHLRSLTPDEIGCPPRTNTPMPAPIVEPENPVKPAKSSRRQTLS